MNIFALIESDHNVSISDVISNELSFLNETDNAYNEYETVSNECIVLKTMLYDEIGLEDFKETVKNGFKYILKLLLKACISIGNVFRRISYFFSKKKSPLIIKKLDEDMKEYEVLHPEIVDESKVFWSDIDFDKMPEASYESKSLGSAALGPAVFHIEDTILYRLIQLSNILQHKDRFNINMTKIKSRPELSNLLDKAISEVKPSLQKTLHNNLSVFSLIKSQIPLLEEFSDNLRKMTEKSDIKSDVVSDFYQRSEIHKSDLSKYVNVISKSFNLMKTDGSDPILSHILRIKDPDTKKYISNSYKLLLLNVMSSVESSFTGPEVQNVIRLYENIEAQLKPALNKITNDENSKKYEPINKTLKAWVNYINSTNSILTNVGKHVGAINKAINSMGLQPNEIK